LVSTALRRDWSGQTLYLSLLDRNALSSSRRRDVMFIERLLEKNLLAPEERNLADLA